LIARLNSPAQYTLLKQLDLYHYWEPFHSEPSTAPSRSLFYLLRAIRRKHHNTIPPDLNKIAPIGTPVVFCYDTLNQQSALNQLIEKLNENASVISALGENKNVELEFQEVERLGLRHWSELAKCRLSSSAFDRSVLFERWHKYFEKLGLYEYLRLKFSKSKPSLKLVIGSNDHSGLSQYAFVAARKTGIPSLYIQHAAVSDKFPPLSMDFALLDGADARDKYLAAGSTKTHIRLIGAMKYDNYLRKPDLDKHGPLVGICFSRVLHDLKENLLLCEHLEKSGVPFAIRFHPAVSSETRNKFLERDWEVSSPEKENSLDFILRCHTVISGDSSILLEASLLKRRPVYFASDGQGLDYYGFAKAGVVEKINYTYTEVLDLLDQEYKMEAHRRNAKHFHDPLYTEWEGRSTELAMNHIREITGMDL
jgi:hypothetical protein